MFPKKFYFILIIVIAVLVLLFTREFRRALGIITKPTEEPLVSYAISPIPMDENNFIYGNPGAPITVTEFADLGCSRCREIHEAVTTFIDKHPQDMRLVWKDAPIRSWWKKPNDLAHEAAYCAGKQGKFWQFIGLVMQDKNNLKEEGLERSAAALRLNVPSWTNCRQSNEPAEQVAASEALFLSLKLEEVPSVFVNNRKILLDENINIEEMLMRFIESN